MKFDEDIELEFCGTQTFRVVAYVTKDGDVSEVSTLWVFAKLKDETGVEHEVDVFDLMDEAYQELAYDAVHRMVSE